MRISTESRALVARGDFSRNHRIDKLVEEVFAGRIQNALFGGFLRDIIGDCLHEVSLSEPRFPVDKEGIKALAGVFGDRFRGGVYEFIRRTDDKGIEREILIHGHRLEVVPEPLVLLFGIGVAPVHDEAEIRDAEIALCDCFPEGYGVFFHDGIGGEVGGRFENNAAIDHVHGFEVFDKRVKGDGRNNSFRLVPNLLP